MYCITEDEARQMRLASAEGDARRAASLARNHDERLAVLEQRIEDIVRALQTLNEKIERLTADG